MNRTQRAIKRSCKKSRDYIKRQKREALSELRENTGFCNGYDENLAEIVKEEKGLKKWHRECVAQNHSSLTPSLEVGVI